MLKQKLKAIMEFIVKKKMEVCIGAAGALILGGVGAVAMFSDASTESDKSDKVAVETQDKKDTNDKKNEETKSDNNNKKDDKKSEVVNNAKEKKEEVVTADSKEENKEDKKETSEKSNSENKNTNSNTASGSTNSTSNSNNNGGTVNTPVNTGNNNNNHDHTHNWIEITDTIISDEVGHWETIVLKPEWTEEVPVYGEKELMICFGCGQDISHLSHEEYANHAKEHMLKGEPSGWSSRWEQVQTGTETIVHPAETEMKWIVDVPTKFETVIVGYQCSICGERK